MGEILSRDKDEPIIVEQDALKSEHLAEGIRPITVCIGTREQYGEEISKIKDIEKVGHDVNYYEDPYELDRRDFKNAGHMTYVISVIDKNPKYTKGLENCTSLVATGVSIDEKINISFLTHQDSFEFLNKNKKRFIKELKEKLDELKRKCVQDTVDIVLAGGDINVDYTKSIQLLASLVQKVFSFSPVVVGPKESDRDDIFFDTSNRRLYMIRPDSLTHNDPFKPDRISEMKNKWREEKV